MTPLPWDLLDHPAVVIRPYVPDLHRAGRLLDQRRGFDRCALVVSRDVGTATWFDDRRPQHRVDLRIGHGPGELAAVVRALHPRNYAAPEPAGRLLLVDGSGRVLGRSRVLREALLLEAWPDRMLAASGLPVREERFENTRRLQKAHRGAAPSWPLTAGHYWNMLSAVASAAVLVGLFALLVILTGWSA